MKLSDVSTKLTCMKSKAVRVLAAATLAGAVLTAGAPAAKAQHVSFGVQIGGPRYVAPPAYGYGYGPGFYERRRIEELRAREAFIRQQEFYRHQREHRFHDYDRGYNGRDHRY